MLLTAVFVFIPTLLAAQLNSRQQPVALDDVGVTEHLGDYIPLETVFANANGDSVTLGSLLKEGKPVLLNPLYYECPMLCGLVIDGVMNVTQQMAWVPGKEFIIISFSIDPEEKHELAAEKKNYYLNKLNKEPARDGWYFLTGNQAAIDTVVQLIGFKYNEIANTGEFAHSAAIVLLSPEGKITRYLYGIKYNEFDVRNALYESAEGKIGNTVTKLIMYCYQYDPDSNSYVPLAINIMKLGGLATLIFLGIFIGLLWLRERKKSLSIN